MTDEKLNSDEILTRTEGSVGYVTLNRPKALNSLNQTMIDALTGVLTAWQDDPAIETVVLDGAGERGLCAGGDVVALRTSALDGGAEARKFFYDEYTVNGLIGRYRKPYVAVMDGIVMGGGVGVSVHGSVRVVTDTTKLAMPEVGIGFIPDVGGTYVLAQAPGGVGLYAALTGSTFSGADAIELGFADHFVPHDALPAFKAAIASDGVEAALAKHAVQPPPSTLAAQRHWIDECFGTAAAPLSLPDILSALRGHSAEEARKAADVIGGRSPIAVSVTREAIRLAADHETLEDALVQEYRVSCASLRSHDFVEGIRAQLVDKDRNPQWSPASFADVTEADIAAYFLPADPDLSF
ncbi:3-hydroxyisobutyryl-CoA hydrolase [Mycobacterium sp. MS1601]|uniref:enoyl-CoA hydratase/isomerase family protein n=1 Tax=Mycobacterium sp. MS1601 TaxID=1936029 RepID=UPI00097906C6|nr:enoyl-CoA hydratase/isomerase family protein [Mycobacterium sp. MS1601]AQA03958.1 3-hydroxyisobutyryl-CoA hydrolase [Mycobacterium sp. MS1601]